MSYTKKDILSILPNTPDDVIEQWLLPYAKASGWPPKVGTDGVPIDRWAYLMMKRPISFWANGTWELKNGHVSIQSLSPDSQSTMIEMADHYLTNATNIYSMQMSDIKPRISRIIEYIKKTNLLPGPPMLLNNKSGFSTIDGNHRLCAYYICYGYINLPVPKELELLPSENFDYWLYTPQG